MSTAVMTNPIDSFSDINPVITTVRSAIHMALMPRKPLKQKRFVVWEYVLDWVKTCSLWYKHDAHLIERALEEIPTMTLMQIKCYTGTYANHYHNYMSNWHYYKRMSPAELEKFRNDKHYIYYRCPTEYEEVKYRICNYFFWEYYPGLVSDIKYLVPDYSSLDEISLKAKY